LENKEYGRKLIFEKRSFGDKRWMELAQDHIQQQGTLGLATYQQLLSSNKHIV